MAGWSKGPTTRIKGPSKNKKKQVRVGPKGKVIIPKSLGA